MALPPWRHSSLANPRACGSRRRDAGKIFALQLKALSLCRRIVYSKQWSHLTSYKRIMAGRLALGRNALQGRLSIDCPRSSASAAARRMGVDSATPRHSFGLGRRGEAPAAERAMTAQAAAPTANGASPSTCEEAAPPLDLDAKAKASGLPRVLIAGGGIGGLVAAVALIKRGYPVQVFERDLTAIRGEGKYRGPIQVRFE